MFFTSQDDLESAVRALLAADAAGISDDRQSMAPCRRYSQLRSELGRDPVYTTGGRRGSAWPGLGPVDGRRGDGPGRVRRAVVLAIQHAAILCMQTNGHEPAVR